MTLDTTTAPATAALLEPVAVGGLRLANRLVLAPLTRSRTNRDGTAGPLMRAYYAQRASAGLIISESIYVSEYGRSAILTPGLCSPAQIGSWVPVTAAVHAAGGHIFAQLMHAGRVSHPDLLPGAAQPVAPSAVRPRARAYTPAGMQHCPVPRELTGRQVGELVGQFAAAARAALEAGFDGVEIHAGNGFLINQFLCSAANRRTDGYGGSAEARSRFAVEVVQAACAAVGAHRVGLRISPWNSAFGIEPERDGEQYEALVALLPRDLAYLHLREVDDRPLTERLRAGWPGTLILNPHPHGIDGGPATVEQGAQALADGVADAVCFGTLFLANPDLPRRIRRGGPYNEPRPESFYQGGAEGYTDYPFLPARASAGRRAAPREA